MKLSTARKISAHAAVLFAFGALALGGAMPAAACAAFALLLPVAFALEGRLKSETAWPGLALFALLALLSALFLWDILDLAVAASTFAMALVLQRLFTRRRAADDGLLYLTALLMLTGGAALTAELLYAVCFAGFALSATTALTLSQISQQAEALEAPASAVDRLLTRRLFGAIVGLSTVALCAALALFFAFPRMTAGAFARKAPIAGRTGFSDQIRLDAAGRLKADPRPALRVRINPDPGIASLNLHWRGAVFDLYDGLEWRREPRPDARPTLPRPRLRVGPERDAPARLSIEVFPAASDTVVFVPEHAVGLEALRAHQMGPRREMPPFFLMDEREEVRLSRPASNGFRYEVARAPAQAAHMPVEQSATSPRFSLTAILDADALERFEARAPLRSGIAAEHLLFLPPNLDPRIPALARRLTEGKVGQAERVKAIEAYLAGFAYSTELDPGEDDPLAHFLFERRAGHCELFATAMAVMLRSIGIPARVVGGFYGGERTEAGDYVVRLANAHAWVEVFLGDEAIAVVDPTPPEGRLPQTSGALTWLSDRYDQLSIHWQRLFVDLTLWDQWRALRAGAQKLSRGFERLQRQPGSSALSISSKPWGWVALLLLVLTACCIARRSAWLSRCWHGRRPWQGDPLAWKLHRQLKAKLRHRGYERRPCETEREFVERLKREGISGAPVIHLVTERYLASRFGMRPFSREEAKRLRRLVRSI